MARFYNFFWEKVKQKPFICHMKLLSTISLKIIDIFLTYAVALTSVKIESIFCCNSAKNSQTGRIESQSVCLLKANVLLIISHQLL